MHRMWRPLVVVAIAAAVVMLSAGMAFAATAITTPSSSPFVVPSDGSGNPLSFTVVATGFAKGVNVYVEICDGVPPNSSGWDPTLDCDNGASNPPVISDPTTGTATFTSPGPREFDPVKGIQPSGQFNCIGPDDPPSNNGVPDWTNCQLKVSTSNTAFSPDQVFLTLVMPDNPADSATTTTTLPSNVQTVGACDAGVSLGKVDNGAGVGLTDTNQAIVVSTSSLKTAIAGTVAKGTTLAGSCNILGAPVTPLKVSAKLSSTGASCASSATPGEDPTAGGTAPASYPLNGKLGIKEGTNGISTYVSVLGFNATAQDVIDVGGIITKGDLVGARVKGSLWEDPAVKDTVGDAGITAYPGEDGDSTVKPKALPTFDGLSNTGYSLDIAGLAALGACSDGVPNNLLPAQSIKSVLVGSGASVLKQFAGTTTGSIVLGVSANGLAHESDASGLSFTFGE
ncbi:MAG TPA: hypothetical protein VL119_15325 [Acidimicrobiia bacterium]|nr:hypothetical protein [Acidimicrobiia bacterium]